MALSVQHRHAGGTAQAAVADAVADMGAWAAGLRWDDVPPRVQDRLSLVLLDSLGVTVVGAREDEQRALVEAWRPPAGQAPLLGGGLLTSVDAAAWLNASALVRLELDEGHKYAKGHPAAHGLPAVLALAADRRAAGTQTMAALLVAYEVASRFGRATRLRAGAHPHGSWGVAGAAAGCARLLGLDASGVAAAIDAASGLPVAAHFNSALDGNPVRDAWVSASNTSGLVAARMAQAGLARNTGTAASSLGTLLGEFAPEELGGGLGQRWDVELGYFKRHASCSFTHPAADAALALRAELGPDDLDDVQEVLVETHSLGAGLSRTTWDSRLGALFSTPFVVAAALVHGEVTPAVSAQPHRDDHRVRALAQRVSVRVADDLDALLPDRRAARVTMRVRGRQRTVEVPNPVGDSAFHPMGEDDVLALLGRLLPGDSVARVHEVTTRLPSSPDVSSLLQGLADA